MSIGLTPWEQDKFEHHEARQEQREEDDLAVARATKENFGKVYFGASPTARRRIMEKLNKERHLP